jgi:hypothetical protein
VFWRKSEKESSARSQTPITVSYPLEEVLTHLEGKLDKLSDDISRKIDGLDEKIDKLTERFTKIEIGQATLTQKIEGMSTPRKSRGRTNHVQDLSHLKGTKFPDRTDRSRRDHGVSDGIRAIAPRTDPVGD